MGADLRPVVIAALVAGLAAGYGIAMPVGAVAAYLVALTARTSLRSGVFAALGVATADGVYALIAVCGGAALAPALRPVALQLRWASAVVLIALAIHGAVTAVRRHRAGGGALLGRVLTGSRGRLITALASSILIAVLAVHLLLAAS
jgi:threonine/homoserine/homoserine lactone efflux protein